MRLCNSKCLGTEAAHIAGDDPSRPDLVHSREGAHGVGHIVGAVREGHDAR
jgi:hypothetical protein